MASYTSKVIATVFAVCNQSLTKIKKEGDELKAENHKPDILGGTFDNTVKIIELEKDTSNIYNIMEYFKKFKR